MIKPKHKKGLNLSQLARSIVEHATGERLTPRKPPNLKSKGKKAFEVQFRKGGKFLTIAKGLPLGKALKFGAERTMTSLRQTFRLLPKGETSLGDIGYNIPSKIFTRPKRPTSALEFVERRGMTLKRGTGEIPQIQAARRSKGKWY